MPYLYNVCLVIEDEPNNLFHQNIVDNALEDRIKRHPGIHFVGSRISELDTGNFGRCCRCGAWVSDQEQISHVDEFSDGCMINNAWWCDLCLPNDHPRRFS